MEAIAKAVGERRNQFKKWRAPLHHDQAPSRARLESSS